METPGYVLILNLKKNIFKKKRKMNPDKNNGYLFQGVPEFKHPERYAFFNITHGKATNNTMNIIDMRRGIYNYMYSIKNKEFLLISKKKIIKRYLEYAFKSEFHRRISEIIISYQNNRIYRPFYKQIIPSATSIYTAALYQTGYSSAEYYMEPINIKQFILNLKFTNQVGSHSYYCDNFICVKTTIEDHANPRSRYYKEYAGYIYEAEISFKFINTLKELIPNFLYTYAYSECSKIIKGFNNKAGYTIKSWCDKTEDDNRLYPYLTKEAAYGGNRTLRQFLDSRLPPQNMTEEQRKILDEKLLIDLGKIIYQFDNALTVAKFKFNTYYNRNITLDNLIVAELGDKYVDIQFYRIDERNKFFAKDKLLTKDKSMRTDIVLYIEDHSNCAIDGYDYQKNDNKEVNTLILIEMINKYIVDKKIVESNFDINNISAVRTIFNNNAPNYNEKVIMPQFGYRSKRIAQKALNYCTYGSKDNKIPNEFKKYVKEQIQMYTDFINKGTLLTTSDFIEKIENYILFIDTLIWANCIDYIEEIAGNEDVKKSFINTINNNMNNINQSERNDYIYTINKLSEKLPNTSILMSIFGSYNFILIAFTIIISILIFVLPIIYYSFPGLATALNPEECFYTAWNYIYGHAEGPALYAWEMTWSSIFNKHNSYLYLFTFVLRAYSSIKELNTIIALTGLKYWLAILGRITDMIVTDYYNGLFLIKALFGIAIMIALYGIKAGIWIIRKIASRFINEKRIYDFLYNILTATVSDVKDAIKNLIYGKKDLTFKLGAENYDEIEKNYQILINAYIKNQGKNGEIDREALIKGLNFNNIMSPQ